MGYEMRRTIRLEFEDPAGGESAIVRLTSMTIAEVEEIDRGDIEKVAEVLAAHLVDWNLILDGEPLPADREGIRGLDYAFQRQILDAWVRAASSAHPLVLRSDAGQQSDPPPMTMDDL
jgi:hypothetical protein